MSQLLESGWESLPDVLSTDEAYKIWTNYLELDPPFCAHYRPGWKCLNSPERGLTHQCYAPEDQVFLVKRIQERLEEMLGEELIPTYWYSTVYFRHSFLMKHKDREACEISLSVNISSTVDWPLQLIDKANKVVKCNTPIGQGVVFLGRELSHWRNPLIAPADSKYMQSFFHYVRKEGPHAHLAYDHPASLDPQRVLRLLEIGQE